MTDVLIGFGYGLLLWAKCVLVAALTGIVLLAAWTKWCELGGDDGREE